MDQPPTVDSHGERRTRAMHHAGRLTLVLRILGMGTTFVSTPIIVNGLGSVTYGIYATITALTTFIAMSDLGVGSALLTRLPPALVKPGPTDEHARLVTAAYAIAVVMAALVTLVGAGFSWAVSIPSLLGAPTIDQDSAEWAFRIFIVGMSLVIPLGIAGRIQGAQQKAGQSATWQTLGLVLSAISASVVASVTGSLVLTVLGTVVPIVSVGFVQSVVLMAREPQWRPRPGNLSTSVVGSLLGSSGGLLVLQIATAVAYQTDIFIISNRLGSEAAGSYAVTLRLFSALSLIATALMAQYWPAMADALARQEMEWVRRNFRRTTLLMATLTGIASTILVVLGTEIISWWVGPDLVPPMLLLFAFGLWSTYSACAMPMSLLLNAAHVIHQQAILASAMAIANLALSVALTQAVGISGPVWGSLVSHLVVLGIPSAFLARKVLLGKVDGEAPK